MASCIYTRTGDTGETGLFGGRRVAKSDLRIEACGAVDELNASIGAARASGSDSQIDEVLSQVQNDLLTVGADLAAPGSETVGKITSPRTSHPMTVRLENAIDRFEEELQPLTNFILPGGHPCAAALHLSRTVCRRAERHCVNLMLTGGSEAGEGGVNPELLRYINRLSDLLFVLARAANMRAGVPDVIWKSEV